MGERLHYTNKTLVGNWYEDRLDESKVPIPELDRTGKYRQTPLKMSRPVTDMYVSTNAAEHGRKIQATVPEPIAFVSRETLQNAMHTRNIPEEFPTSGFGSILPKHVPGHDSRYLQTTAHCSYGGKYANTQELRNGIGMGQTFVDTDRPAGKSNYQVDNAVMGVRTAGATAEALRIEDTDPKSHTFVQRSWMTNRQHFVHYVYPPEKMVPKENIPGLGIKGLGVAKINPADVSVNHAKRNDTLRRDVGIWSE